MQLTDRIPNCNGCEACLVGCKYMCVKMTEKDGVKVPQVNEDGCSKCNACMLYCPIYNPVELPEFQEFFQSEEDVRKRDMAPIYRATMRRLKEGKNAEFVGTLCQIAALKSLRGDKLGHSLAVFPIYCSEEQRKTDRACMGCSFYK